MKYLSRDIKLRLVEEAKELLVEIERLLGLVTAKLINSSRAL